MFNWLISWFSKKEEKGAGYSPKERQIYQYFAGEYDSNGEQIFRKQDPMVLWKDLMEVYPFLDIDLKVARSQHSDNRKCWDHAVKTIRELFNVKSLAEGGLGEIETMELLDSFVDYVIELKKNSNQMPTFSKLLVGDQQHSSEESQPTSNTLDSGSTEIELPTEKQESSCSELESPTEQSPQELASGEPKQTEKEKPLSSKPNTNQEQTDE